MRWCGPICLHRLSNGSQLGQQCVRQRYSRWNAYCRVVHRADVVQCTWPIGQCRGRRSVEPIPFDSNMVPWQHDYSRLWWRCSRHAGNTHREYPDWANNCDLRQSHGLRFSSDAHDWSVCSTMLLGRGRPIFPVFFAYVLYTNRIRSSDVGNGTVCRSMTSIWTDRFRWWFQHFVKLYRIRKNRKMLYCISKG